MSCLNYIPYTVYVWVHIMGLLVVIVVISCYTGDFQAQDIVQDLNRLLDMGPDRNATMLRELLHSV